MRAIGLIVSAMVVAVALPVLAADDAVLKNAPKDAIAIIHVDGKAADAFAARLADELKKTPDMAEPVAPVQAASKLLKSIEAIDVYVTMGDAGPGVIVLLKTGSTVPELYAQIKDIKLPIPMPKELKAGADGQYTAEGLPLVIVEGKSAPDVGAGYVAIVMDPSILKTLKAGAGEKLSAFAKKVDMTAPLWGVADLAFVQDEEAPVAVAASLYPDGKKPSALTLTFRSEAAAGKTAEQFPKGDQLFKDLASLKQDKADVTFSATMDDAFAGKVVKALVRARELARRAVSAANLSAMGKAVAMYEVLNEDKKTTADPNELIKENLVGAMTFFKPGSGRMPELDENKRLKNTPDYVIFDLPLNAPADLVKAYEPLELNKGEGGNVLLRDSSVRWMKADGLKAAVAKTEKYLKDAKAPKK